MNMEERTLGEVLSEESIARIAPDAIKARDLSREEAWGKTIRQLELRNTYGVNVIAVRSHEDTIKIPPDIDTPIPADVVMVMLGKYEMFENLKKK